MSVYGSQYPIAPLQPASSGYLRGEIRYEGSPAKRDRAIAAAQSEMIATIPDEDHVIVPVDAATTDAKPATRKVVGRKPAARKSATRKPAATRARGRRSPTTH